MNDLCLKFVSVGTDNAARRIAVRVREGAGPGLFWLGGFNSDMRGIKAQALDLWARDHGRAMVRFDYSGHGESGGNFTDGTIGCWLEDSFGMTLLALGWVGTLIGVAELIGEGSMVAFTDRIGKRNSLAIGIGAGGVLLILLSLVYDRLVLSMVVLFLAGVVIEFGIISTLPLATELRPRSRARVLSLLAVSSGTGRVAGDLVAPRVFTFGGMRPVTLMAGLVALVALTVVLFGVREVETSGQTEAAAS